MMRNLQITCPMCGTPEADNYRHDRGRDFVRCRTCGLVFVPASQHLSAEAEKRRYDLHRNSAHDPGYRNFLGRIFVPLQQQLAPASSGLDFGSGPEPVLARMFEEAGHTMAIYDQFYARVPEALEKQYDFITATEVVEHLRAPGAVLPQLWNCLKPGGLLGIMTRPVASPEELGSWHYKNDLTHICFFSPGTFRWLARGWNADLAFLESDIVLLRKRPAEERPGRTAR